MRLIFAGTPKIAAYALAELSKHHEIALVITRPDAALGRKKVLTASPVARIASELGLDVLKANKISQPELDAITRAKAELGIVLAYGALMPQAALDKIEWWNLHFSLLPKWRGATPLQHSMMNSDGIGMSIFALDKGLDTGPLIDSKAMSVEDSETAGEALDRFTTVGVDLMLDALTKRPVGQLQLGEASLAPIITREQARIDFQQPSQAVAAYINALNPEPMAWVEIAGSALRILRAKPLKESEPGPETHLDSGEVLESNRRVLVGCGQGTHLELLEVQPAGKRVMSAQDWFRGLTGRVRLD